MNTVYIKSVQLHVFVDVYTVKRSPKLSSLTYSSPLCSCHLYVCTHAHMHAHTLLGSMMFVCVSWENGMQPDALAARLLQNSFSL